LVLKVLMKGLKIKMNIKLNLNIFLFVLLFFITNQLEIYALVMLFALIHELAHLICGVLLGFKPNTLKIMPLGFCIEFDTKPQDYNIKVLKSNYLSVKKILIALAGPLINSLIIIFGIILELEVNIIFSNLIIILFNLIPIYPLDGGRILQNILKILFGNKTAYKYTNIISNVFIIIITMISSVLILVTENIAILILIIILWILVIKENKRYNTYNKIYKVIDKNYNYL